MPSQRHLLCACWPTHRPLSLDTAFGHITLCLRKVKFEVTGEIVSDTPKQQSSHLFTMGYQTDMGRNVSRPELHRIYLYMFFNVLSFCPCVCEGVEGRELDSIPTGVL